MKRLVLSFAAVAALAIVMPVGAVAKHHHNSGHHKHGKGHHARLLRFGSLSSAPIGSSGPSGPSGDQPSNDTAGTVDTFANGVLTITLNDGTTVSGKVTSDTEIECEAAQSGTSGDDDANEDSQDQAQQPQTTTPTAHESDDSAESGDSEDQGSSSSSCGTTALTHGTVVKEAELEIGSGGAVFHSIHLIV